MNTLVEKEDFKKNKHKFINNPICYFLVIKMRYVERELGLKEKIIGKLGTEILSTMSDPVAQGWAFEGPRESVVEGIAKVLSQLKGERQFDNKFCFRLEGIRSSGKRSETRDYAWLASRIPGHDLTNISFGINTDEADKDEGKYKKLLALYTRYRAFCLTMPYVASGGDPQFLSQIPTEWLSPLLSSLSTNRHVDVTVSDRSPSSITTAQYVALEQLVKNARRGLSVEIDDTDYHTLLSVSDKGPGLYHEPVEDQPVPLPDNLVPTIFGDFSTREYGGFGLQLVKALTEFDGGYIDVTSTHKDPEWAETKYWGKHLCVLAELRGEPTPGPNITRSYSTKTGVVQSETPKDTTGSEFKLFTS